MKVNIIGGGLSGAESAYYLLKRGYEVQLFEMRGVKATPCHKTQTLCELVCSNSLKSMLNDTASGLLKAELRAMNSLVLEAAEQTAVKAGSSLAVDRELFSDLVQKSLLAFDNFTLVRKEVSQLDNTPTILATGPMSSDAICAELSRIFGDLVGLRFYDAVAPIVSAESIDMTNAFFASRYEKGDADYLNCPMTKEQYLNFYEQLVSAQTVTLKDFEKRELFNGCMPIEEIARSGIDSMRFGPLRPVGISHPLTKEKYYAVLQLRSENLARDMLNLVGFQTNLTFGEQKRVFGLIPALKNAEFLRYGVMHRNTFVNSPQLLNSCFQVKQMPTLFIAGQLTGVEGYMESAASGLLAAIHMDRYLSGKALIPPPLTTISGALSNYIACCSDKYFQPMNSNFGILPTLENAPRDKKARKTLYYDRGVRDIIQYVQELRS